MKAILLRSNNNNGWDGILTDHLLSPNKASSVTYNWVIGQRGTIEISKYPRMLPRQ